MTVLPEVSLQVLHFDEPQLEFAFKQQTAHPKDGLFLYGPHSRAKKTRELRIGVIGTQEGINHFGTWAKRIKGRVEVPPPTKTEKKDRLHLANFPGLEEAFGVSLGDHDFAAYPLDAKAIERATLLLNLHEAVRSVVKLYADKVRKHQDNDERAIDLWILVVPEFVYERCRPNAKRAGASASKGRIPEAAEGTLRFAAFARGADLGRSI